MFVSWGRGAKGKVERVVSCGMDELRVLLIEKPFRLQGTWADWASAGEERRRAAKSKLPWIIGGKCMLGGGSGRTLTDVASRSLVTLDVDDCVAAGVVSVDDMVQRLETLGVCGFVYETITSRITAAGSKAASGGDGDVDATGVEPGVGSLAAHTGLKLRIIVPLAEDIAADDYAFAARVLALRLGLLALDDKSFRPAQIMYLPATFLDDGMARVEVRGEPWDALDELQAWPAGVDAPRFAGEDSIAGLVPTVPAGGSGSSGGRADGIISAFLGRFDAMDALLRFCGDRYEDAGGGRLRRAGSASMGGVVRVDRGVYSHHSGDCVLAAPGDDGRVHAHNAFDAVRIVKGWTVAEMVAWAAELPEIRGGMDERVMRALDAVLVDEDGVSCGADDNAAVVEGCADDTGGAVEGGATAWATGLARKNGRLLSTFSNVRLCMANLMKLRFNEMTARVEVSGRPFTDRDVVRVRQLLEMKAGMEEISDRNVWHGATSVALENAYDPVKEWIESEEWDGVERLDHWLTAWTRCEDNELNRWTGRLTMLALVARQYEPGTKYDYAVVLKSGQGAGKDTLWSRLGGAFYRTMSVETMMFNREAAENTRGGVIVDMTELGGLSKTESAVVKEYITRTVDRTRHAYDREVTEAPRRFVLVGSTNQDDFLVDETGNRRFLVVASPCDYSDPFPLPPAGRAYQQLWAEALVLYRQAREIWPSGDLELYLPRNLSDVAGKVAEAHSVESEQDVFNQKVAEWVDSATQFRDEFRVGDVLQSLGMRVDRSTVTRVGRALRGLTNWAKVKDEKGAKYVKRI